MTRNQPTVIAGELLDVMERLITLQERLHAAIREKLEAMRRADVEAMRVSAREEGRLVEGIEALDHARSDCMDRLCVMLAITSPRPSLREVAARLGGTLGERLANRAGELRTRMLGVAEANRVVELASRAILDHFKQIFAAMARDDSASPTYGAAGRVGPAVGARLLDSVV